MKESSAAAENCPIMRRFLILSIAAVALVAGPAKAATVAVTIEGFAFAPSVVSIEPGDSITWTNLDAAPHTATAQQGAFDSGTLRQGESFTFTFENPGVYEYFCAPHPNMTGAVRVGVSVAPPSQPVDVRATPGLIPGSIQVSWQPPADDGGLPVTRYLVCRGTSPAAITTCASVTDLSMQHGGLPPLTTYYFTVAAANAAGLGPPSAAVCSKPSPWLAALGC